jgi:hypothetical protein
MLEAGAPQAFALWLSAATIVAIRLIAWRADWRIR